MTSKAHSVRIYVDDGIGNHELVVSGEVWASIVKGKRLVIQGNGFTVEGENYQDFWRFNEKGPGTIHVDTDEWTDIYEGVVGDAGCFYEEVLE